MGVGLSTPLLQIREVVSARYKERVLTYRGLGVYSVIGIFLSRPLLPTGRIIGSGLVYGCKMTNLVCMIMIDVCVCQGEI